ncbi:hypothetical protein PM3016_2187 [Paenibacillus mucilaginosus 3016]|uniref:Uncharacterized protein n=1 Tax=Paenibacillus mucilaginosus 3016 TaxID=1116391 RepID=H6NF70_9BACL|nr:hypothetical protein PM3016_2187 [Paenibacillus mucilaginosus 3016]
MERSADIGERYTYKRTGCGGGSSFCLFREAGAPVLIPTWHSPDVIRSFA